MIQPEDLLRLQFVDDVQLAPDGSRLAFVVNMLEADAPRPRIDLYAGGAARLFTDGNAPRWSPDGRSLAFLRAGHLYVSPVERVFPRRLTAVEAGTPAWSPDGTRILFPALADPPPADAPRVIRSAWHKADDQGLLRPSHLHVCTLEGTLTRLSRAFDITPTWSPDGRRIAFARMRPGFGHSLSDIWTCAPDGSQAERLTRHVTRARCPAWSADGSLIAFYGVESDDRWFGDPMLGLWVVAADGSSPPRKIDLSGRAIGYVPPQYVESGPLWDGDRLIVPVVHQGSVQVLAVSVESGETQTLVPGEGHVGSFSFAAGRLAWVGGHARDPGDVYLDHKRLTQVNSGLLDALPAVERRVFHTRHGAIEGWLYGRTDGPPLPLLLDVHGGPHSFTANAFSHGHFYRYVLGARGWIVLAPNPSGSGSYGADFAASIRGCWGEQDLPEHLAAIDQLIAEGLADPARLAITGYSYGGYLTCWALSHSDRFKVGVAGGAVTNLESFFGTADIGPWFAPYEMGADPAKSRDIYRRLSPVQYASRIAAPLLLLHGENDDRCPMGQAEEMFSAVSAIGQIPCELVRYPGATHLMPYKGRPSFRVDYARRVIEWIERYAGPATATAMPEDS